MAKYRSTINFASAYEADKNGYSSGVENFVFLKQESVRGTFTPPAIPTQGVSTSGATPSLDISAGSDDSLRVAVDGGAVVTAKLLSLGTLSTGSAIAAALETAINLALTTAGQDGRVWVEFAGGLYKVASQKAGVLSKVVITDATSDNVADALKLGLANGGTEAVGTNGTDFLFMTKASLKAGQDFEDSKHMEGLQSASVIRKKIMAEGDLETYVCFDTEGATPKIDPAVALLLEGVFGRKTVTASEIIFDGADGNMKYFSALQVNNIFNRAFNGAFAKNFTLTLPGDGEASMKYSVKAADGKYAGISKVASPVAGTDLIPVQPGEEFNVEKGGRVMLVDTDGRTVLVGMDGSLTAVGRDEGTHAIRVSTNVTVPANGFVAPWSPNVLGVSGLNVPVTGLQGSVSFDGGATQVEQIRSVELSFDPKTEDFDNYYGADGNRGGIKASKAEIGLKVEMNLTGSEIRKITQIRDFRTFSMKVVLGDAAGRHLQILCPKVQFKTPDVEIPESGTVPVTLEGKCLQTETGKLDAVTLKFV